MFVQVAREWQYFMRGYREHSLISKRKRQKSLKGCNVKWWKKRHHVRFIRIDRNTVSSNCLWKMYDCYDFYYGHTFSRGNSVINSVSETWTSQHQMHCNVAWLNCSVFKCIFEQNPYFSLLSLWPIGFVIYFTLLIQKC